MDPRFFPACPLLLWHSGKCGEKKGIWCVLSGFKADSGIWSFLGRAGGCIPHPVPAESTNLGFSPRKPPGFWSAGGSADVAPICGMRASRRIGFLGRCPWNVPKNRSQWEQLEFRTGIRSRFGNGSGFGIRSRFGNGSGFGNGSRFGNGSGFGIRSRFGNLPGFGNCSRFGNRSRFGICSRFSSLGPRGGETSRSSSNTSLFICIPYLEGIFSLFPAFSFLAGVNLAPSSLPPVPLSSVELRIPGFLAPLSSYFSPFFPSRLGLRPALLREPPSFIRNCFNSHLFGVGKGDFGTLLSSGSF
ncbi:PREDICTED: uncharacterized protein LOC108446615 [Corvus brachyrhynchos]|uniref:uncharacterized protein LOC108446615 n=1 Tax=Corvus brachyrhynchos TaxID=85066 RepID=UPI0008166A9F|nr:PREDICTED: uncharacterized protein LOC108446615 [Corvus brachyrhynchos]